MVRPTRLSSRCLWASMLMFLAPAAFAQVAGESSKALFQANKHRLFVVESIDRGSRNKNSVGSGFLVMEEGLIATNYHVVSQAVLEPDAYGLRVVGFDDHSSDAEILAVDPVHDLAVIRRIDDDGQLAERAEPGFPLARAEPAVGEEVMSLGNPLDVGLSIVPGTFNGRLQKYYRPWIHFTGALNPGMSGGPAINTAGEVIGINVAGAGNSVGFLIPVSNLVKLIDGIEALAPSQEEHYEAFGSLIREHQDSLIDDLIAGDWALHEFGPLQIPKEIRGYVNCTGATTVEDSETAWARSSSDCRVNDRLYLGRKFDTGPVEMHFSVLESEQLNEIQFAELFSRDFFSAFNSGGKDELTKYECIDRWTILPSLAEQRFKANYCLRAYVDFPGVYDVLYIARGMPASRQGLNIHYTITGVSREAAGRFHEQFLGSLRWK